MGAGSQFLISACAAIAGCSAPAPTVPADLSTRDSGPEFRTAHTAVVGAEPKPSEPASPRRDLALPRGWATLGAAAFEAAFERWNPTREAGRLDAASLDELRVALEGPSPLALRAVLLLAASGAPEAASLLLDRLERRIRSGVPDLPAVDVAAAAGLSRASDPSGALARALADLANGRRPHPVLCVRVECAAASLALGRVDMTTFLAAILQDGTEAALQLPASARGAMGIEEMAFAQWRASSTLAQYAHIENPYRPEASAVDRANAAAEIVRAVRAASTKGS